MNNNKNCNNFLQWYFQHAPAPVTQNNCVSSSSENTNPCINPVYSLIDYTVTGTINSLNYYQTVITNNSLGNRIWTFTVGGLVRNPTWSLVYQFNPNCFVPNGVDTLRLGDINFNSANIPGQQDVLQGSLIVNNYIVGLSGPLKAGAADGNPYPITYTWDQTNATFTFFINLTPLIYSGPPAQQPVGTVTFDNTKNNSFYSVLTIKDACLAPFCRVLLSDGTLKRMDELDGSETLYYSNGKTSSIRYILKKRSSPRGFCRIGKLVITEDHPIHYQDNWVLPGDHYAVKMDHYDYVYQLVLSDSHEFYTAEGVRCASLGYRKENLEVCPENKVLLESLYGERDVVLSRLEEIQGDDKSNQKIIETVRIF